MSVGPAKYKRTRKHKMWQHPRDRKIRVPRPAAMAIAIMEMGVVDLEQIALAVDLPLEEVMRIEQVENPLVRRLCHAGIPYGVYFRLYDKVRCPKCDAWVTIAPCVLCDRRQKPAEPES